MRIGRRAALAPLILLGFLLLMAAGGCSSNSSDEKKDVNPAEAYLPNRERAHELAARAQLRAIADAWRIYETNNGSAPANVEALIQTQPIGEKPLLKPDAIIDPWGQMFQVDPAGPMNGGDKPDIWTTMPGGKKIGNWEAKKE